IARTVPDGIRETAPAIARAVLPAGARTTRRSRHQYRRVQRIRAWLPEPPGRPAPDSSFRIPDRTLGHGELRRAAVSPFLRTRRPDRQIETGDGKVSDDARRARSGLSLVKAQLLAGWNRRRYDAAFQEYYPLLHQPPPPSLAARLSLDMPYTPRDSRVFD